MFRPGLISMLNVCPPKCGLSKWCCCPRCALRSDHEGNRRPFSEVTWVGPVTPATSLHQLSVFATTAVLGGVAEGGDCCDITTLAQFLNMDCAFPCEFSSTQFMILTRRWYPIKRKILQASEDPPDEPRCSGSTSITYSHICDCGAKECWHYVYSNVF